MKGESTMCPVCVCVCVCVRVCGKERARCARAHTWPMPLMACSRRSGFTAGQRIDGNAKKPQFNANE